MDTKSKNNPSRRKMAAILLIPIVLALFILVLKDTNSLRWYTLREPGDYSYYINHSSYIRNEMIRYAKNLNRFYIYYYQFEDLPVTEKITQADLNEKAAAVQSELINSISEIENRYNAKIFDTYRVHYENVDSTPLNIRLGTSAAGISEIQVLPKEVFTYDESLYDEKSKEIEEAKKTIVRSEKEIRALILEEKEENYNQIKNYLETSEDFQYYITQTKTGEIFTNIDMETLEQYGGIADYLQHRSHAYASISDYHLFEELFNGVPLQKSFSENYMEGYILIPTHTSSGKVSAALSEITDINLLNQQYFNATQVAGFIKIFLVVLLVLLVLYSGLVAKKEFTTLAGKIGACYAKLPLVIKGYGCLLAFLSAIRWSDSSNSVNLFMNKVTLSGILGEFFTIIWLTAAIVYIVATFLYLIHIAKNITDLQNEFEIYTLFVDMEMIKKSCHYAIYVLFSCAVFLFISGSLFILFITLYNYYHIGMRLLAVELFFLGSGFLILCFAIKYAASQIKYSYYLEEMLKGNTDVFVNEKGFFSNRINKLRGLNDNIKRMVDEKLRSEKLKTELITNVSHDLKTPLTSIIGYLDILKDDTLPKEKLLQFIDILDKKAYRLKILIEDLFEISKLASGQVTLNFETVDIVDLLKQSLGELDEKIQKSNINFRFYTDQDHILMRLDGKKMWRVFENLINNIIKYSQEGTRAYIDVKVAEKTVTIIMKNISNLEMNFAANELFERFKRGDSARSTEGTGLGLSIAKSIVELHGGKLQIEIDGDLFKIIIILVQ